MKFPATLPIPDEVLEIARRLDQAGHEVWCVGGALRDFLIGDPSYRKRSMTSEIDIATSAVPEEVQKTFRRSVPIGVKYGTVGVIGPSKAVYEVTTFRRDVITDGRHAVVQYGATIEEDLARRDFTINAIAYHPLRHEWRDPFGGAEDLERGVLRAVGDPAQRFREDYLRVLRALRFAARFGLAIEPATWKAARAAASGLSQLSAERVRDEWFKGIRTARSLPDLVGLWSSSGAAGIWLPELEPERLGSLPSPPLLEPAARDPVVFTVLLCADPVGVLRRLKASNAEIDRAAALVAGPSAPEGADEWAVRRWLARVGGASGDLVKLATIQMGRVPDWADRVRRVQGRGDPLSRSDLAITGNDLLSLGASGPRVGEILIRLLDRVLEDPALNTRDTLLALARELI
jgi:tRNA nucleotidyltransferase (CCA-adding enzyme)